MSEVIVVTSGKGGVGKTTITANHSTVQPIPLSQSHLINQTQSDKNKQSTGLFNPTILQSNQPANPTNSLTEESNGTNSHFAGI